MQSRFGLFIVLLFFTFVNSFGQTDTEFWFAAPNISEGHDGGRLESNVRFSSQNAPATVTIRMPANNDFEEIEIDLDANETHTVDMTPYFEDIRNFPVNTALERGLLIESTNLITAYYEISTPNNPDIFSLKGSNALGTEFYVPFQNYWDNSEVYRPRPYSSIDIVATQDNTEVTITPTNPVFPGRPAGVPFTINLDRGETFAVVPDDYDGAGQQAEMHLGGTKVESNNDIAIISNDDSIDAETHDQGPCKDVVGDQIVPTDIIGYEYIAMKGRLDADEHFYVIGTEDDTEVYINDNYVETIDEGEIYRHEFDDFTYHIETSEPSYVYHIAGFGCEMGAAVLPPIDECTGSTDISFTRSKGESFFLNILVRNGAEDAFILNDDPDLIQAEDFEPVPGNDEWLAAEFEMDEATIPVREVSRIVNTSDVFHLGIINGGPTTGVLYGYFSDFNPLEVDAFIGEFETISVFGCYGDSFELVGVGGTEYSWTPEDYLDDPNIQIPTATPPESIQYKVVASGACNMVDSAYISINIFDPVIALFSVEESVGCSPFDVVIEDHSMGFSNYSWSFGDGTTSSISDELFAHTYTNNTDTPQTYHINLTGRRAMCWDTLSTHIVVFPEVEAKILNEDTIRGCSPSKVSFEEDSRRASKYLWDFGDGSSSKEKEPTHTFHNYSDKDTTYTVILEVISEHGCIDYDTVHVNVDPYVEADFHFDPSAHCSPYPVKITNASFGATINEWDFNDGLGVQNIDDELFDYLLENTGEATDTFNIALYAENEYGCADTLVRDVIVYPHVEADFEPSDTEGCNPLAVNFINNSEKSDFYYWDFDVKEGSSYKENPEHVFYNHSFSEEAEFNVKLIATSEFGCSDTASSMITVYTRLKTGFTFEQNLYCSPYDVLIHNNAVGAETVHWDFGDGNEYYESEEVFYHTFENLTGNIETYTITQTVTNEDGCEEVETKDIVIYPEVEADFSLSDQSGCHPLEVTIENESTGAAEYHWDFGDGGTSDESEFVFNRTFYNNSHTDIKEFEITLNVESEYGCMDSITKQLEVYPKPKADLDVPVTQGCSPFTADFIDKSIGAEEGDYHWIFGDGSDRTTSHGDIDHVYDNPLGNEPDSLVAKLIIENRHGCIDSISENIVVFPDIEAEFLVSENNGCHPLEINITNNSQGATASAPYQWSYGDANNSVNEESEHKHVFNNFDHENNSDYTIKLLTKSQYGCKDSVTTDITVYPNPKAKYSVDESTGCSPHTVEFSDLSVGGNEEYIWTFDDGETSGQQGNVSNTYTQPAGMEPREFNAQLEIINEYNCSDIYQEAITVYPEIEADFVADLEGCHPLIVDFEDSSQGVDYYHWSFGDDNYSSKPEPQKTYYNSDYEDIAYYDVELLVSSQYGCFDSIAKTVEVYPKPEVDFHVNTTNGCSPLEVLFENLSIGVDQHEWDFGDNISTSLETEFDYTFENKGNDVEVYNVKLTGGNEWGCYNDANKQITVYPEVKADFSTVSGSFEGCSPLELDFVNYSELADNYEWSFDTMGTSIAINPTHTFTNVGEESLHVDLELLAISSHGCKDSVVKEATIYPQPVANFEVSPHRQFFPSTTVEISNYLIEGNWTYRWDMGDGNIITTESRDYFEYTYELEDEDSERSIFEIDLQVYSDHCFDDIQQEFIISPPYPVVDFSSYSAGCPPFELQFSNESKYGIHYFWDFDDGNYSTEKNPVHEFKDPGIHEVTLEVAGLRGSDSIQRLITVFEPPIAGFLVEPNEVYVDEPVTMMNVSSLASTYEWDFGDGYFSDEYEPEHSYQEAGSYDIILRVGNDTDPRCFNEVTVPDAVKVKPLPCNIMFPNAFKPLESGSEGGRYTIGDPKNHIFHPVFEGIKDYRLEIFNRWGELIFVSNDIMIGWGGYHRGQLAKMDVYVWKVNATCENGEEIQKTGDVVLIR